MPFQLEDDYEIAIEDYVDRKASRAEVELGRLLFFDKILSGNKDISCGTCHHPTLATADGLSLPVGTGGKGLGPARHTGDGAAGEIVRRMPRHALALFGLGHRDHTVAFYDGRVREKKDGSFTSPAGKDLPTGLENIVAVTAMFPVQPHEEMSGEPGDNRVADAAARPDFPEIWRLLAARVSEIPEYVQRFRDVYGVRRSEIAFHHIGNALAAFIIDYGRVNETAFERYYKGDPGALSREAKRGAEIFFGRGGCSACHNGPLFSDMKFHAIGMPQVGPGKGHGWKGHEDYGREGVTEDPADRYKFRTPILLNVAHTAPYGHAGQFATLEAVIQHHATPERSGRSYVCGLSVAQGQLIMPSRADLDAIDCAAHEQSDLRRAIGDANELEAPRLSGRAIRDLIAFLTEGLTDGAALEHVLTRAPDEVPSGLPVD